MSIPVEADGGGPLYEPDEHPCHREGPSCAGGTYQTKDGTWECAAHLLGWAAKRMRDQGKDAA